MIPVGMEFPTISAPDLGRIAAELLLGEEARNPARIALFLFSPSRRSACVRYSANDGRGP